MIYFLFLIDALFCRPYKQGVLEWKAKISIRTLHKEQVFNDADNIDSAHTLAPHLCYACHTTLTSRSSRAVRPDPTRNTDNIPLPVWTRAAIMTNYEGDTLRVKHLDRDEMKSAISEFLVND